MNIDRNILKKESIRIILENQTQTAADLGRILEKVKKCLALSASDNAGESGAALRQARAEKVSSG